jgi:hypothetical protein
METRQKYRATKRTAQHKETTTYGVVLHDKDLIDKIEAYREEHDMSVSRFFELATIAYFEDDEVA